MANLIRKTCTKLYQNRPPFVKDMTKTFWCVFRFIVLTAVHLQNPNANFHKLGRDTIWMRQKMFIFLYDKFAQDNMYQILSQSVKFCRLYIEKHFGVFSVHSVDSTRRQLLWMPLKIVTLTLSFEPMIFKA